MTYRFLTSASALFWGLQFAFLNPTIAVLLVSLYGATQGEVGLVLAVYNAAGFLAAIAVPVLADRRSDYLRPMLACGLATLALAAALWFASDLPSAVIALVVLGGPAGVGVTLLFADIRSAGHGPSVVIGTRAVVSFAWVAGPPLATFVVGAWGGRSLLVVLAVVALGNIGMTAAILRHRRASRVPSDGTADTTAQPSGAGDEPVDRSAVVAALVAFVALQATNVASVSIMGLFVVERLGIPVWWSGIALGVSALLEIPALLVVGRMSARWSAHVLILSGSVVGLGYYVGMSLVGGPVGLVLLQVLNAWFIAVVTGVGLTFFQELIPRAGLASGLYTNTRRVGSVVSGGVIALGALTTFEYQAVFVVCAVLVVVAIAVVERARRAAREAVAGRQLGD